MKKALIFDIDGTLWDSRALVAEGFMLQLEREGIHDIVVNAEIFKPLFGKVNTDIADALFPSIPAPERYDLIDRCMASEAEYMKHNPCHIGYPKVKETLETLSKEHRLFIVSNSQRGYPELCIEKMGLGDLIEGHLCYGQTLTCKGQTIRKLMETYGLTDAIYIGDTQGDYEATVEAGIPFVWCTFGFGQPAGYAAKIDAFEELLQLELIV